jgi:hypothetical protein
VNRLVVEYYPTFRDRRAAEARPLPRYVEEEFEAYLKCGRLEEGFLRVRCELSCREAGCVLGSAGARPQGEIPPHRVACHLYRYEIPLISQLRG